MQYAHLTQIIALFILLLIVLTIVSARYIIQRILWKGPQIDSDTTPPHVDMPDSLAYTHIDSLGTDRLCVYYPKRVDKTKRTAVFCHGVMCNCESNFNWYRSLETHFNVFAWDYRNYGRSERRDNTVTDIDVCVYDLQAVLRFVQRQLGIHKDEMRRRVFLIGRSLGAYVAMAHQTHATTLSYQRLDSLVLLFPLVNLVASLSALTGVPNALVYPVAGSVYMDDAVRSIAERHRSRLLIIASSDDTVVSYAHLRELVESLETPQKNVQLHDVGGLHTNNAPIIFDLIAQFFAKT